MNERTMVYLDDVVKVIYQALRTPLPDYHKDPFHDSMGIAMAMANEIPSAQPEQRWIPVSEKLPEEGEYSDWYEGHRSDNVLITVGDGVTEAFTIDGVWNWDIDLDYYKEIQEKVTAWMPLPEPYKGEEE